jgi:hypothetical protein
VEDKFLLMEKIQKEHRTHKLVKDFELDYLLLHKARRNRQNKLLFHRSVQISDHYLKHERAR